MWCYLRVGRACVAPPESWITACVLQAETGLVSLSYFESSDGVEEVVVAEGVHAVVVSVHNRPDLRNAFKFYFYANPNIQISLIGSQGKLHA